MQEQRLVIISDTHISAGPLDDFDQELEGQLCRFLEKQATTESTTELVINGDFLDFIQAPLGENEERTWERPELRSLTAERIPLCFTQKQSLAKLVAILQRHGPVFNALGQFLAANDGNRLTILPGNHDADFFWPKVREQLKYRIAAGDMGIGNRVHFHLDQVYRPFFLPSIWIEHGHQHDPCNEFSACGAPRWSALSPPILVDPVGQERLLECVGTRFLLRYLNRLDESYPFVDNVKPLSRFVTLFAASSLLRGRGPFRAAVALWGLFRFLGISAASRFSDLLGLPELEAGGLDTGIGAFADQMTQEEQLKFIKRLEEKRFPGMKPLLVLAHNPEDQVRLMDFLAENPELIDGLSESPESPDLLSLDGTGEDLTLAGGFKVDETRELKRAALKALTNREVEAVVMGHTHEAVDFSEDLQYANTGCWIRYYCFDDNESALRWPLLRNPSYSLFPYRLLYVEAGPGSAPKLVCFDEKTK
jgi:UDP-2,3-diacylglucosamine pyrophosphatase LpxH